MGHFLDKHAKKISHNTSTISTNTSIKQCNTTIQPSNPPVQLSNIPVQSSNIPVQSSNTPAQLNHASIISSIKPPKQFVTEEEFFETWLLWKNDFLIFRKIINSDKSNNGIRANLLLNIMGPIGQEMFKKFIFNSVDEKNNLDVLLNKFDEYYTIASIKKLNEEDPFMYIHHLQLKMKRANIITVEELIRNRILKEIDERMFTNAAKRVLPSFKFTSDFNKLTLKEIAFIWKLYDCKQFCDRCGNNHSNDSCPAMGKQCLKCKEWNHFLKRCPLVFIHKCKYCGDSHFKSKCPAYNEICTKCKGLNHFSWKCLSPQILNCIYCGLTHVALRSRCPAKDTFCTHCKERGHFAAKCKKNSYSKNH